MYDRRQQTQREAIATECAKRGIAIEKRGNSYLLRGAGVDVQTVDLALLTAFDLAPHWPRERMSR
ncbi:MAG: hypothetical protein Q8S20_08085 [Sulfuritalea sp.]|nr:hypothetical protein [Sulfuritalea sp.]